jgi:hypothetical protein
MKNYSCGDFLRGENERAWPEKTKTNIAVDGFSNGKGLES